MPKFDFVEKWWWKEPKKNPLNRPHSLTQTIFLLWIIPGQNIGATTLIQNSIAPCPLRAPLVVILVGLPCRGKSLAAHKIARHLCWKGEYAKGRFDVSLFLSSRHPSTKIIRFVPLQAYKFHWSWFDREIFPDCFGRNASIWNGRNRWNRHLVTSRTHRPI